MSLLYGRVARLTAKNGGFRPVQFDDCLRDALPRLLRRGQRKMRGSRSPRGASVKSIYEEAER